MIVPNIKYYMINVFTYISICIKYVVLFCICKIKLPGIGFINRNLYYKDFSA